MDIYIGGVRDRNAALHGDVVAALLVPQHQWKVLYPQLDAYLEEHEDLKALVYKPIESTISHSDNALTSTLQNKVNTPHNTNLKSLVTNKTGDNSFETDCDVVVEDNSSDSEHPVKKKKHRRGKKKKSRKGSDEAHNVSLVLCQELVVEGALDVVEDSLEIVEDSLEIVEDSLEIVEDSIEIISCPSRIEVDHLLQDETLSLSDKKVIIVPPHELSECDLTDNDDESVKSLTLDMQDSFSINRKACVKMNDKALSRGIKCKNVEKFENVDMLKPSLAIENIDSCPSDQSIKTSKKKKGNVCSKNKSHPEKAKCNMSKKEKVVPKLEKSSVMSDVSKSEGYKGDQKCLINLSQNKIKPANVIQDDRDHELKPDIMQVMRLPEWENFVQKIATVVHILERKHSRLAAGILKQFADRNPYMALFSPFDCRIPRIKILIDNCPPNFIARPNDYAKLILLAKITEWNDPKFAFGELCRDIGQMGDIEVETEALLLENNIDYSEFPEDILSDIPSLPWSIPSEEFAKRRDLRDSIIFTIDPASARDLDDAVSCLALPNGNFRVGVHIADASHFVRADSQLDKIAADRATSVYLIQKVIPMLPRPLCEELCSLNPGQDRLAFSVIWELSSSGEVEGEWFGRSVIRSCVKLSYEHAQTMIENPNTNLNPEEFPPVSDGHSLEKLSCIVNNLHKLAVELRKKRINHGALRLNQVRMGFSLDSDFKTPNGIYIHEQKDSNRLIEEFMLLANLSVAHKITAAFPKLALLRKHPPPHEVQIVNTIKFLKQNNIHLDASSSKTLNDTIEKYSGTDPFSLARMQLIVNLCSKPMQYARYFCAGNDRKEKDRHHYALNVPCYTHFTSPIRRYADIIVHRLLACAMDKEQYPLPQWNETIIERIAHHCNEKRQASKLVQETSSELYLNLFVRNIGEMVENGMIIGVLDRSIDVLLLRVGVIKRCYMERLPLDSFHLIQEDQKKTIIIQWSEDKNLNLPPLSQKLSYFDCVTVILRPFENDALKINAFLARPEN